MVLLSLRIFGSNNITQINMAFTAKLQFGNNDIERYDKEYLVTDVRCHFSRHHNQKHPEGKPYCEQLKMSLVAPDKYDTTIYSWFTEQGCLSGRILFDLPNNTTDESFNRSITFDDAICYSIEETYDNKANLPKILHISLCPQKTNVGNIDFTAL